MTKIRLDIESISAITLQSSQQQNVLKDNFLSGLAAVDRRIARVEEMLRDQADRVQASQFEQVGSSYDMSTVPRQRPSNYRNGTYQEGMSVRVRPFMLKCRSGCPCSCHFQPKKKQDLRCLIVSSDSSLSAMLDCLCSDQDAILRRAKNHVQAR